MRIPINPTFIVLAVVFAIVVIAGYIIAKKRQTKLKWWFPLMVIVALYVIMLIVGFLLHVFHVME